MDDPAGEARAIWQFQLTLANKSTGSVVKRAGCPISAAR